MKVGILSDTHDNLPAIKAAVEVFRGAGVSHILHGGDYIAPFAVAPLKEVGVPVTGVFGNNDGERLFLQARFKDQGWVIEPKFAFPVIGERRFVVHHEPDPVEGLAVCGMYDVVVYGHTHEVDIRRPANGALVVNPGETCGWLTGRRTCVILDLESLEARTVELPG